MCTAVIVEATETATSKNQWDVLGTQLVTQLSENIRNNAGFMNRCEVTRQEGDRQGHRSLRS